MGGMLVLMCISHDEDDGDGYDDVVIDDEVIGRMLRTQNNI